MSDEALRWFVVIELAVLITCGTAWHRSHRHAVPAPLWRVGWGYGWVLVALTTAVVVNLIMDQPVTVGLWVVAFAILPASLWIGWCTYAAVDLKRPGVVAAERIVDVLDGVDHPDDGPPCDHPGCIRAREELRRLTGE